MEKANEYDLPFMGITTEIEGIIVARGTLNAESED